jgi:hypothetical protein
MSEVEERMRERQGKGGTHVRVDLETTLLLQTLGQLPRLVDPDLVDLRLDLLPLPPLKVLFLPLLRSLGGLLLPLGLCGSLLGRSPNAELLGQLVPASDDGASGGGRSLLGLSLGEGEGEESSLGVSSGLRDGRIDELDGRVEDRGKSGELRSDEVGSRGLKVGGRGGRGGLSDGSRSRGGSARKGLVEEDDGVADVVDPDGELGSLAGGHDKLLELLLADGEGRDELENVVDGDGVVDLGQLLEETGENDMSDGSGVLGEVGRGRKGIDDGGGRGANGERVEIDLEEGIERSDGGRDSGEDVSVDLGGNAREREKSAESTIAQGLEGI